MSVEEEKNAFNLNANFCCCFHQLAFGCAIAVYSIQKRVRKIFFLSHFKIYEHFLSFAFRFFLFDFFPLFRAPWNPLQHTAVTTNGNANEHKF